MPIYMDVHNVPGVKARDVAEAHRNDLLHQEEYGCNCMTYWIDEQRENIFCLIEAPDKDAVKDMHNRAHGLVPHKIIEVSSKVVQSFLGRIYDPSDAVNTDEGLKVFHDPSFRVLMITSITDPVLLRYKLGNDNANELLARINTIVRKHIALHQGSEVEHGGAGFISSFMSASKAVACAMAIQTEVSKVDADATNFKIAINGGEPIEKSNKLFGDTILLARHLCHIARNAQVAMSSPVRDLIARDNFQNPTGNILTLSPQDEKCLEQLFSKLEENWSNAEFDVPDYCQAMAMSKSQLYRKTISFTGLSPNILLKDFRLEKAKEMMKKQRYTISQITFESGFTSPSYFTKCFKKKYDLLPMAYLDLLH
jgi:AraC-like DNA-binding protein